MENSIVIFATKNIFYFEGLGITKIITNTNDKKGKGENYLLWPNNDFILKSYHNCNLNKYFK